jgi:hypothetical protein
MNIPPKTKPQWAEIVTGKKTYTLKFLAAKILLGRIVRTVASDPSKANVDNAVNQLFDIYQKNANTPSVAEDMKAIFG